MSIIKRLGKNLQYSFYQRVTTTLAYLLVTPFILSRVDSELYGLNALLLSIVGYFRLMDFGLSSGVSRFTAKFIGENREKELNELINIGVKVFFFIGLVAAIVLFGLSFFYENIFDISRGLVKEGRTLFYIYAFASFFIILSAPFKGVLRGGQRQDVVSKVDIVIDLGKIVLAILILVYFKSYLFYVFSLQLFSVLLMAFIIYQVHKLFLYKPKFSGFSKDVYREVVGFSGLYFLLGLFGVVIYQVDNLVIGQFLGLKAITIYSIAFILHTQISSLNSLIASPLFFIFSTEFAKGYSDQLKGMITDSIRMHIGLMIPVLIITIINVDHFILAWVGESFEAAILPARILLSYFFFSITFNILVDTVIGGLGKIKEAVVIAGLIAFANLVLSIIFVRFFGIVGVAIGTSLPYIIVGPYYIIRFCGHLSLKVSDFVRQTILPNLPHVSLSIVLAFFIHAKMENPNLIEVLSLFVACYAVTMMFGYLLLNKDRKQLIKRLIRSAI